MGSGKLNINERSRQILSDKELEMNLREKNVITKYFKKN